MFLLKLWGGADTADSCGVEIQFNLQTPALLTAGICSLKYGFTDSFKFVLRPQQVRSEHICDTQLKEVHIFPKTRQCIFFS